MRKIGAVHFIVIMGVAIAAVIALAVASGIPTKIRQPLQAANPSGDYGPPELVGRIETSDVTESSGLSASDCQDVLWTHNDAGNAPFIFAMDMTGKHLGTWKVEGARSIDWESIAAYRDASGSCFLLIADLGDNDEARRNVEIYRIPEPQITTEAVSSTAAAPLLTAPAEVMKYTYADGSQNAESMLVHPKSGDIYIVTKEASGPAGVHRIKQQYGSPEVLRTEKLGDISVPSSPKGQFTDGSYSPDGTRVMLCDKKGGYELVLPAGSSNVDDIWKQEPAFVDLGDRKQGEGVSYGRDGKTLYASSEEKKAPLYMIKRKG